MLPKLFDISSRGPISDYDVMLPVVFQYKISKIDFRRLVLVRRAL